MALPTSPTNQLYQTLYGPGEAATSPTATGTTVKPPTTFQPLATTTQPKQTWPQPQPGSAPITAQPTAATAPVPNSPVTRTGQIPAPAPFVPPKNTWPLPQPGSAPITEVPSGASAPPPSGTGGLVGFSGPARTWFDQQGEAQKQKAFAAWNSWTTAQRQAFLALPAAQQQQQLQTLMGGGTPTTPGGPGTPAPGTGGTGGTGGGGTAGEGGSTSLPTIAGFPLPGNAPQWVPPDQTALNTAQNQLLLNVLQNPESMTDAGVAALHQQQMEQILAQQEAARQQFQQASAARGTFGGGYDLSLDRRLSDATTGQLTQSSRDIAIQRMIQDMEDRRAALGLSDQILTGQTGRAATGHQQQLGTFGAELEKYFGGQDVLNAIRQRELQKMLGLGALDVDRARLGESARQFNLGHVLDWARLRSGDELGRLGIGTDLAQLNAQRQADLQRLLFGG